jgi:uncharacterized membrane protein YheB (UPF0754 family)
MGALLVSVVFVLFAVSFLLSFRYPQMVPVSKVLLGGFIGGFTNTVAIRMLFEKRWYLPGSGVLLKSREKIVHSLAQTIETHILNSELLEEWLRERLASVDRESIKGTVNPLLDEFREDLIRYVKTEEVQAKLLRTAEDVIGKMGFLRHMVRLLTSKERLIRELTYHLSLEIAEFEVSDTMLDILAGKAGSFEDLLLKPNNPLVRKHYQSDEPMASYFFSKFNVRERIVRRLSGFSPERLTEILERNMREHLVWLEVFGVLLGCVFAALFEGAHTFLAQLPPG